MSEQELEVLAEIELIADPDGTFGARWTGKRVGATWGRKTAANVLEELGCVFADYGPEPAWMSGRPEGAVVSEQEKGPTIAADEDMDWGFVLVDGHAPDYDTARRVLRDRAREEWLVALGTIEDHDPQRRSYRWISESGDELVPCEPDDSRRNSDWWVFDLSMNDYDLIDPREQS